jgi:hypothetical protein
LMTPLLFGAVLNAISSSIITTALASIGRDFAVGPKSTGVLLLGGVLIMLAGWRITFLIKLPHRVAAAPVVRVHPGRAL